MASLEAPLRPPASGGATAVGARRCPPDWQRAFGAMWLEPAAMAPARPFANAGEAQRQGVAERVAEDASPSAQRGSLQPRRALATRHPSVANRGEFVLLWRKLSSELGRRFPPPSLARSFVDANFENDGHLPPSARALALMGTALACARQEPSGASRLISLLSPAVDSQCPCVSASYQTPGAGASVRSPSRSALVFSAADWGCPRLSAG